MMVLEAAAACGRTGTISRDVAGREALEAQTAIPDLDRFGVWTFLDRVGALADLALRHGRG